MRKLYFLIFSLIVSVPIFAQNEDSDILKKSEGFVVEVGGNILRGKISINICTNVVKVKTADSTLKIGGMLIKEIHKDSIVLIPKSFNDSSYFLFCQAIDTQHTLKLFKTYVSTCNSSVGTKVSPISPILGTGAAPVFGNSFFWFYSLWNHPNYTYALTIDEKDALILEKHSTISVNNYKKMLLKAFGDNKDVVALLNSYKKIKIEDVPEIVSKINEMYKE